MSLTMHIYNKKGASYEGFDVSEIVHDIEYTTSILGQAGKLSFIVEKDPNEILQIGVGSLVKFWHSDNENEPEKPIFMGNVFTIGTDRTEAYRIVAYDQTRYLQNHENYVIGDFENDLQYYFHAICDEYFPNSENPPKIVNWDKYIKVMAKIRGENFVDVSAFDILQFCMDDFAISNVLKINSTNFNMVAGEVNGKTIKQTNFHPKFYIRDNFGTLELREIFTDFIYDDNGDERKEFLVIGDESLLTDYQYEIDIDKDTYNEFYIMCNEKKTNSTSSDTNKQNNKTLILALQAGTLISGTNTTLDGKTIGENTIPDWGILRKIVTMNDSEIKGDAINYIKELVELYNQPTRSLKLSALGLDGVFAGSSFIFSLNKLKIKYPVYVISATHYYNGDSHKMDLQINSNPTMGVML